MRTLLAAGFLLLFTTLASAQLPGGNVYVGYSFVRADIPANTVLVTASGSTTFNGWNGSLELKLLPWVGGVADFGGNYGTQHISLNCQLIVPCPTTSINANVNLHTYLFGPRVSVPIGRVTPFAHALFGLAQTGGHAFSFSESDSSFSTAIGGGIDYRLIRPIAWRVQGDFLHTRFFNTTQNNFRFSTGLALHF
jgi:Outer membrane protein beta-barrel domain